MEVDMQLEPNVLDTNKGKDSTANEHINKKLKLSEPIEKDPNLDINISINESNDIQMPLTQEIESVTCSSVQKTPEGTIEEEPIAHSSRNVEDEPGPSRRDDDSDDDDDSSIDTYIPKEGFNFPIEQDASDMLDEVDGIREDGTYPTVTERYFTPYYQIDIPKPGDDICLLVHSNRICMFTLAPSHAIYQENKKIIKCDYKVSEKLDRLKNKVSGKAKHGAQPLQNNSNLCRLTCDDRSVYTVKCCIIGKLVEVNERLVEDPELLKKLPHHGGYIAIALPNLKHLDKIKSKLLDQNSYEEALKKRKEKNEKDQSKQSDDNPVAQEKSEIIEMKTEQDNHPELVESENIGDNINLIESEKIEDEANDIETVKS